MRPTYDELFILIRELRREIEELKKENAELKKENAELKKENAWLKEQLNLNSKNSSKPPSTDQKKNKLPPKGGAKKGHSGRTSKQVFQSRKGRQITLKGLQRGAPLCRGLGQSPLASH